MNFRTVVIASVLLVCLGSILGISSNVPELPESDDAVIVDSLDLDDAEVRENPVIEGSGDDIDISVPAFVKESANAIQLQSTIRHSRK